MCCAIRGERGLDLAEYRGLHCLKLRGGGFAFRLGLRDGAAILIQHGQFDGQAERPFVVVLIEVVARSEMNVGILLCDLQTQRGLGGGVVGQRSEEIGAMCERALAGAAAGRGGKRIVAGEIERHGVERGLRQTDGCGKRRSGDGRFFLHVMQRKDVEEIVAGAVVGAVVGTLTDAVTGAITGEVTGTIPLACTTPLADTIPPPVTLERYLVVPLVVPLVLTGIEYLIEV